MQKSIKLTNVILALALVSQSVFSCATIGDFESPSFCQDFDQIAKCHCSQTGLPAKLCQNVSLIYSRMISTFGSIEKACRFQKDTTQENCIDAWKCYREGGQLSNGKFCSGSGIACIK